MLVFLFRLFGLFVHKDYKLFGFPIFWLWAVEGYSRNASCTLNLISTCLLKKGIQSSQLTFTKDSVNTSLLSLTGVFAFLTTPSHNCLTRLSAYNIPNSFTSQTYNIRKCMNFRVFIIIVIFALIGLYTILTKKTIC